MIKTYVYNGTEYKSDYAVRQAILSNENKAFPAEPVENKAEFWLRHGVTYTEAENPEPTEAEQAALEIRQLKYKLAQTDYAVIKIAEGAATADEYSEIIAQRQTWRARINELEETLSAG